MKRLLSTPSSYLITDRQAIQRRENSSDSDARLDALVDFAERAAAAGIDLIQIRERDLQGRELLALTTKIAAAVKPYPTRLLVNDRADVAAICGVGVHLTTRSMRTAIVRRVFGDEILIGVSTHSLEEAREAERSGADFIVFGPVFETPGKMIYGAPVGLRSLGEVAGHATIPVLALGGIKLENYQSALAAGASGIAAITLFTDADDLTEVIQTINAG